MDKIKLLKEEIERILLENQSSGGKNSAYADGMISALANVLADSEGKEKFLRDYANGILHVANVLYGEKDTPGKMEEYVISKTNPIKAINSITKCKSLEEAEELMRQQVREEKLKVQKELGYLPVVFSSMDGGNEICVLYKGHELSWYKLYKI